MELGTCCPACRSAPNQSRRDVRRAESPTVYYAQLLQGAFFPQIVGSQILQPIQNTATASYAYIWSDLTYLFQGPIVATVNQFVIGVITGSRFEIGIAGTLNTALSAGGTAEAAVEYVGAFQNAPVTYDNLLVYENIGLAAGQSIAAGTGVFVEWDNSLFAWVVVAAACAMNRGPQNTVTPRGRRDTPISTGPSSPRYG